MWGRLPRAIAAFLVTACLLAEGVPAAFAQARNTSILTGRVLDETDAVLPGVTVTLTSPNLVGGADVAVTDAEGNYRFPSLPPGLYEMTFELPSFNTVRRTGIIVELAKTITVDVQMTVATLQEAVTVIGGVPVVDVKTAAANSQLDEHLLQNLPTSRFQPDMINLAPGVTQGVAFGATQDSNALLIDGVDISDPSGGTSWSFFNYNWIGEVQIVALGANAEYGEFTGLAANSVVRSGSNNWEGLFEYWTEPNAWLGDNTGDLPEDIRESFEPNEIDTRYDISAQVGGPIVKDKLFFFTGFQYFKDVSRPAGFSGAFTSERSPRFISKLTWAVSPAIRAEGFVEIDTYDITGRGASPLRPPETTNLQNSPEVNWNGKVTWTIDDKTLLEIRNGGYDGYFTLEPTPPGSPAGPASHVELLTGIYSVNTFYFDRRDRNRNTTAATLTKYVDQFAGRSHEFKFGFEFERSALLDEVRYPGDRFYYDYAGEPYQAILWDGYAVDGVGKRTTFYAQDAWTVNDRITLNPGIRFNFNRGSVPDQGNVLSTNPVSLRLGVVWDIFEDHKTVFRSHYGRYHDALLGGMYQFMDLSDQAPRIVADLFSFGACASGLGPECIENNRFTPEGNLAIDDEITHSYVDQFVVGFERELVSALSVQVQYIRRNYRNFMAFVDDGSRYDAVERIDPGPDGLLDTADDAGPITVFNLLNPGEASRRLTNPPDAERDYNAFQIVGRRRYADDWQLNASYTWSRSEGVVNNESFTNSASGGAEGLGQTGIFANPNLRINQDGRSQFDFTHQVKLEGTYRLPAWGGFNLSAFYRYTTGSAWGRRAAILDLDQGSEVVRIEPRGTRRTDAINLLDFRVEKTFPITGPDRTLGLALDVFNVTNQGHVTSVQDQSGETFGQPLVLVQPRRVRALVRFTF
jgi:hypothetical protein